MHNADKKPSSKAGWTEYLIDQFNENVFAIIDTAIDTSRDDETGLVDLCGVVFPGNVDFGKFDRNRPLPRIAFIGAIFSGLADFEGVTFSREVYFSDVVFSDDAHFREIDFPEDTYFDRAIFYGEAIFRSTTFTGRASFEGAVFSAYAAFNKSTFSETVSFEMAVFSSSTVFHSATFHGIAIISEARFSGNVTFDKVVFLERVDFGNSTFSKLAYFHEADFLAETSFIEATFLEVSDFSNVTFSSGANFREAAFLHFTDFSNADFLEYAEFLGAAEGAPISPTAPSRSTFHEINFAGAVFSGTADFNNRRFTDTTSFRGTIFERAPKFHNAVLHQDTDFEKAEFRDVRSANAERNYRTLKLDMETVRSRREEAMFFALEQRSLRHQVTTPWAVRFASALYDGAAEYGQNFVLPVLWMALLSAAFLNIYYGVLFYMDAAPLPPGCDFDLLGFTLRQLFRPFEVWSSRDYVVAPFECLGFTGGAPLTIRFLAALQTLVTYGLFTLFLLALRKRFRML